MSYAKMAKIVFEDLVDKKIIQHFFND